MSSGVRCLRGCGVYCRYRRIIGHRHPRAHPALAAVQGWVRRSVATVGQPASISATEAVALAASVEDSGAEPAVLAADCWPALDTM